MIRIIYILLVGLLSSDDKVTDYFGGWPFNPNKDQIDGSVQITGSHNPSDYNGFKLHFRESHFLEIKFKNFML